MKTLTTRPMTKSALAVARQAMAVARDALPPYSAPRSRKTYTQHQLFAALAVRPFLGTDYRGMEQHRKDWSDLRRELALGDRVPDHTTLKRAADRLPKKKGADALIAAAVRGGRRLLPAKARAAVDSTGFDGPVVSRYDTTRGGRRVVQRRWPKLTVALDIRSHLILSARVTRGPDQDAPHLVPVVRAAVRVRRLDTVPADAGYDSEDNHATPRAKLKVRSTVIPLNRRGTRKHPPTKYRKQMLRRFRKRTSKGARKGRRVYGQRRQVESGFSRLKRLLRSTVRAVEWMSQKKELMLRVIVYNLMLLAA